MHFFQYRVALRRFITIAHTRTTTQQTCIMVHFYNFHLRNDVFFLLFGFELYVVHNK